ncbi:multicilin [Myiozetetes cayanensis]|uniref:multicilin n=1 Tax=Myiozetetes cayanensis TaxID=478635 RepID=UPI002160BBFB|nr:multicilin [Myiozetetes cayanensis]
MEQGGRRRAFGSICPNRIQCPPARLSKKPARPGRGRRGPPAAPSPRAPPPRQRRSVAPSVPAAPALVLSTIDWQDLAACTPLLPTTPAGPVTLQQLFPPDASTLMPPPLDCTDFDFSLGEEVAFGPSTQHLESSVLSQVPPQCLPSPELSWRDQAEQHQKALGDAMKANSQVGTPKPSMACTAFLSIAFLLRRLHGPGVQQPLAPGQWSCPNHPVHIYPSQLQETLTQRQEELATLRESNVQLKELASQARQLASVLDTLMFPQSADGAALPPSPLHPPPPPAVAVPTGTQRADAEGVDAMLRAVSEKCRQALRSLGGSPGHSSGGSPGDSPTAKRPRPAPRLHGAFRGLRTGRAALRPGGGDMEEGGSLRAQLGEAGAIRTLAFPQGNAFTLRTATGGHQFRWVPR